MELWILTHTYTYVHTHTNCRNTQSSTHTYKERVASLLLPTSHARCLWPPGLLSHPYGVPDITCQVGTLLIHKRQKMPQPPMSTHPNKSVCADGWGLPPASGRETGMRPVYRHPGYALNMGMGLPGGPKAGHIHGAVRAGRQGSQSGVRGEDWVASVPHKRPAKCH